MSLIIRNASKCNFVVNHNHEADEWIISIKEVVPPTLKEVVPTLSADEFVTALADSSRNNRPKITSIKINNNHFTRLNFMSLLKHLLVTTERRDIISVFRHSKCIKPHMHRNGRGWVQILEKGIMLRGLNSSSCFQQILKLTRATNTAIQIAIRFPSGDTFAFDSSRC